VTADPSSRKVIELLIRGHNLYGSDHFGVRLVDTPSQLQQRAEQLTGVDTGDGMSAARPARLRMAAGLHRTAAADGGLVAALADADADHMVGRRGTRRIIDDARSDSMPAADTPLGRQEALRRMATRLRQQRRYLQRSQHHSHLLAHRLRRLRYVRRRGPSVHHASSAGALPLNTVRYEKGFAPGHVTARITAALDRMGITDPAARRNWIRGYQTLIARESGGQPDTCGPGSARGIAQTVPATFARYHQPGTSTNIYDPVANICASMNYVIHRYGVNLTGDNLAAVVQQADAHRPPKGY
jgi:SLT domain-containing protein